MFVSYTLLRLCCCVCQRQDARTSDRVRRDDNPCLPKPSFVSASHYKDRQNDCFIEKQIRSFQVTVDGKVVCDEPIVEDVFKPSFVSNHTSLLYF